jgi:hypothetical protein
MRMSSSSIHPSIHSFVHLQDLSLVSREELVGYIRDQGGFCLRKGLKDMGISVDGMNTYGARFEHLLILCGCALPCQYVRHGHQRGRHEDIRCAL